MDGIRIIREMRGLSQKELAEQIFSSQTNISRIEQGLQKPSKTTLDKICSQMKVTVEIVKFLSLSEDKIRLEKRESYRLLKSPIEELIKNFI